MSHLLAPGSTQERTDEARTSFLVGAITAAGLVRSTLGPKGQLKLFYNNRNEPVLSNDGATILERANPNGPAAKLLMNAAREHGINQGDGTTTLALLIGELLQEADRLIFKGAHPSKIIKAFRSAHKASVEKIRQMGNDLKNRKIITATDKEYLLQLAKTTLSSKFPPGDLDHLAGLALSVSKRVSQIEMLNVIEVPGGEVSESALHQGLMLECDIGPAQKEQIDNPRVLVVNTHLDSDKVKVFSAKASVTSPGALAQLESAERERVARKIQRMCEHADVIISRQIIYDYSAQEFTKRGCVSIERADFQGVEMAVSLLNARILSTFEDITPADIGRCKRFQRIKTHLGRSFVSFEGVPGTGAATLLLHGPSKEIVQEAKRAVIGAVKVLLKAKDRAQEEADRSAPFVYGGGAAEVFAASGLLQGAETEGERAFARALLQVPRALLENSGVSSPEDALDALLKKHREGCPTWGVSRDGDPKCMEQEKVLESLALKESVWGRAAEAAEVLLRCDGIIWCKPRERARE